MNLSSMNFKKYYNSLVTLTSIHAVAYTVYRLYGHYRKNKLHYISAKYFNQKESILYKTYPLKNLPLVRFEVDELGAKIAAFEYRGVVFCLVGYDDSKEYALWVNTKDCKNENKDPHELAEKFIVAIGL